MPEKDKTTNSILIITDQYTTQHVSSILTFSILKAEATRQILHKIKMIFFYTLSRLQGVLITGLLLLLTNIIADAQTGGAIYQTGPVMMRTKIYPFATVLNNGKIISFGGRENGFISCAYADLYDPSTNSFTESPMNFTHDMGAVAKLSDGRYFISGGGKDSGVPAYATSEMYDYTTNTFIVKAPMIAQRVLVASAQLTGGKVLLSGAWYDNNAASFGERYDPVTDTYTATGALNQPRAQGIILPTSDGGAVLAGGWPVYGGAFFTNTEYYNTATNTFENLNSELIPADAGWLLNAIYTRPIDDSRMSNGNYILLAFRSAPTLEFALIEFNPTTRLFSKLITSEPISGALTDGGFWDLILNRADNIAYVLGAKAGTDPQQICMVTVDLTTAHTYYPLTSYTLPAQEYLNPAMTYISSTGKILLQGISSYPDNFNATNKTYLLTPQLQVGIAEASTDSPVHISYYPNPSSDMVNVKIDNAKTSDFALNIYTIMGKLVKSETLKTKQGQINIADISNGIYTIEIKANGWSEKQKLIIQR